MKARSDCARYVADGLLRLNRQPTDKPHARLRVGDVLTLPVPAGHAVKGPGGEFRAGEIRVIRVLALAARRGPAAEARALYAELPDEPARTASCAGAHSSAYPRD